MHSGLLLKIHGALPRSKCLWHFRRVLSFSPMLNFKKWNDECSSRSLIVTESWAVRISSQRKWVVGMKYLAITWCYEKKKFSFYHVTHLSDWATQHDSSTSSRPYIFLMLNATAAEAMVVMDNLYFPLLHFLSLSAALSAERHIRRLNLGKHNTDLSPWLS